MAMWGKNLISRERFRQLKHEGFSYAHDDAHTDGSLVRAAQCHAEAARRQALGADAQEVGGVAIYWPWDPKCLKIDADPVRNLAKAGALIAAEIDRLQRLRSAL